jgi:hypothetical protein
MDWSDVLRLLAIIGLAYGAWTTFKSLVKVRHGGRTYYRQKDGSFSTAWGRRVRDPDLIAALDAAHEASRERA